MRWIGILLCLGASTLGHSTALAKPRPLVHPDTLPRLVEEWSLRATVAERPAAWEAPRFALEGDTLFLHDHAASQVLSIDAKNGHVNWFTTLGVGEPSDIEFTPYYHDNRLFVGAPRRLFYVHAKTGQVRWAVPIRGTPRGHAVRIADILFFATEGGEMRTKTEEGKEGVAPGVSVYALGMRAGRMLWRQPLAGSGARLVADDRRVYLGLAAGDLMALEPEEGKPVWRIDLEAPALWPGPPTGGRLHVAVGGPKPRVLAIDVQDGKTVWEAALRDAPLATLVRGTRIIAVKADGTLVAIKLADGKVLWRATVPIDTRASTAAAHVHGKRLFVHFAEPGTRGRLAEMDPDTGRVIRTTNGLEDRPVSAAVHESLLVLDSLSGTVRAMRLDTRRPPRRPVVTVREYAEELVPLARQVGDEAEAMALADKFHRLGGGAWMVLTGMLQAEEPHVVAIAATALGRLGQARAIPALRGALKRQRQQAGTGRGGALDPVAALVKAIGTLGSATVVTTLEQVLFDDGLAHSIRRDAWVALGRIGSANALTAMTRLREPLSSGSERFKPHPITVRSVTWAGDDNDPTRWPESVREATSLAVPGPKGKGQVVASLAPYLGGYNDIWLWRSPDGKGYGEDGPLFTGVTSAQRAPQQFVTLQRLDVTEEGATLRYLAPDEPRPRRVSLKWSDLVADADGDGLSDRVEDRLGTDKAREDTDGDEVNDGDDLNPLAPARVELSDREMIVREVFFTYFAFFRHRGVVVVDRGVHEPLEYIGRRDPVLTMRREGIRKLQSRVGLHAIDYVGFGGPFEEGATRGGEGAAATDVEIKGNRARVGFDVFRGGESGVGFNVKLRKVAGRWIVTHFDEAWRL